VLVIVYNVWQERRLRRRVAESRRAAERSAAEASRRSAERVEPTLGTQRTATSRGQPAHRTAARSETDFEPPLDVIAPPASAGIADDSPAAASPSVEAAELLAESDEPATGVLARSEAHPRDARNVPQPDHEIEA